MSGLRLKAESPPQLFNSRPHSAQPTARDDAFGIEAAPIIANVELKAVSEIDEKRERFGATVDDGVPKRLLKNSKDEEALFDVKLESDGGITWSACDAAAAPSVHFVFTAKFDLDVHTWSRDAGELSKGVDEGTQGLVLWSDRVKDAAQIVKARSRRLTSELGELRSPLRIPPVLFEQLRVAAQQAEGRAV